MKIFLRHQGTAGIRHLATAAEPRGETISALMGYSGHALLNAAEQWEVQFEEKWVLEQHRGVILYYLVYSIEADRLAAFLRRRAQYTEEKIEVLFQKHGFPVPAGPTAEEQLLPELQKYITGEFSLSRKCTGDHHHFVVTIGGVQHLLGVNIDQAIETAEIAAHGGNWILG